MPELLAEHRVSVACRACGAVCGKHDPSAPDDICQDCWRLFRVHRSFPPGDLDNDLNQWLARKLFIDMQYLERNGVAGRCEALSHTTHRQCAFRAIAISHGRRLCGVHRNAEKLVFVGQTYFDPYDTLGAIVSRLVKIDQKLMATLSAAVGIDNPILRFKRPKGQRGAAPIDLAGRRFGKLVAHHITDRVSRGRHRYWLCKCDCGNEKEIAGHALMSGMNLSCGCLRREASRARAHSTHRDHEGHFLPVLPSIPLG